MDNSLASLTSAVQDDLQDPSFNSARIGRYLNYGQQAIFNTHMFRFTEKSVTGSLTIGKYAYDQQSDHQSTIGGAVIDSTTQQTFKLDKDSYMKHRDFFDVFPDPSSQQTGLPSAWTEFGDEIVFNCPVDKAYGFRQRYYREATQITSSVPPLVPKGFNELLVLYADFRAEKFRGNHDVAGTYKQEFDDGLENMVLRYGEVNQVGPTIMESNRVRVEL